MKIDDDGDGDGDGDGDYGDEELGYSFLDIMSLVQPLSSASLMVFSQPSIYIDGWLYGMSMTSVVCNVPVLSQNDSTYHHSVFTT